MSEPSRTLAKTLAKTLAWDDFRLVKAVADARGMTGAAADLGINHSTVFRRLAQIEEALGTTLFERHRAGYALTPAGEEMVSLAGRLEGDITAFTRRIAGQEIALHGELRITTNDTLLLDLLMPILAAFRRAVPDVRLDLVVSNKALNLSKRDADIAIRATLAPPPDTLVGRRVAAIGWALYGRRAEFGDHPEHRLADLTASHAWAVLGDEFGHMDVARLVTAQVAPDRIACRLNTVLGLAEIVESGIGITYLPCFIGDARPGLVRLTQAPPSVAGDLWVLTHPDLRHSARVRAFLDFATDRIVALSSAIAGERRSDG